MKIFFISYINRSGSSFLSQQLSTIKDVFVFPEGDVLIDAILLSTKNISQIKIFFQYLCNNDDKLKKWNFSKKEITEILKHDTPETIFINTLLTFLRKYNAQANYLIFKKQDAFIKYGKIGKKLKISTSLIYLIRDPRAIFYSQKKTINPYTLKPFNKNPLITAYAWNHLVSFANKQTNKFIIRYESLIKDKDAFLYLLTQLQIPYSKTENNITYFDLLPDKQKTIHKNVPLERKTENIDKWNNYLHPYEMVLIKSVSEQYMLHHGYDVADKSIGVLNHLIKFYFKIRIFLKIDKY